MIGCSVDVRLIEVLWLELGVVVDDRRLIGVDVPVVRTGDLVDEAFGGETMVEDAALAVEDVGVRVVLVGDHQIGQPTFEQGQDRILLAVGVEVADDEDILVPGLGLEVIDEAEESLRFRDPRGVVAALAVALVEVQAGGVLTTLGLEVVDEDRDDLAIRVQREGLGDGITLEALVRVAS